MLFFTKYNMLSVRPENGVNVVIFPFSSLINPF